MLAEGTGLLAPCAHTRSRLPGRPARIKLFGFLVFAKVHVALVRQVVFFFPISSAVDSVEASPPSAFLHFRPNNNRL